MFIVIINFVIFNLSIFVILENIALQKGTLYLTEEQQLWVHMQQYTRYLRPLPYVPPPRTRVRRCAQ